MSESFRHRGVKYEVYGEGVYSFPMIGDWEMMGECCTSVEESRKKAEMHIDYIIQCYREEAGLNKGPPMCPKCGEKIRGRRISDSRQRGENHVRAKLTNEKVREIRMLRSAGEGYLAIAKRFGVTSSAIMNIIEGKTWTHVDP